MISTTCEAIIGGSAILGYLLAIVICVRRDSKTGCSKTIRQIKDSK